MAKKSFFDPVSNAKSLAFLFFLVAFLNLLDVISGNFSPVGLIAGLLYAGVGYGLRKQYLWGVYGVGFLAIISLLEILMIGFNTTSLISLAITAGLFFWFYSAKDRFKS